MAKLVNITLALKDDQLVNDNTVGEALGKAIMKGEIFYEVQTTPQEVEKEIKKRLLFLDALEESGVENWSGYSDAVKLSKGYCKMLELED